MSYSYLTLKLSERPKKNLCNGESLVARLLEVVQIEYLAIH
jgi:hypothetical protein